MEGAVNLLVPHFRQVVVRAAYDNYVRIRFRADDVKGAKVYFNRVPSQKKKWLENGGAMITWRNDNREGPHDAIVFAECPKSFGIIVQAIKNTRSVAVIYEPPSWRQHEQQILRRTKDSQSRRFWRQMEKLEILKQIVAHLPILTPSELRKLLARQAASQSPSFRGSPEDEVHAPGTPDLAL